YLPRSQLLSQFSSNSDRTLDPVVPKTRPIVSMKDALTSMPRQSWTSLHSTCRRRDRHRPRSRDPRKNILPATQRSILHAVMSTQMRTTTLENAYNRVIGFYCIEILFLSQ